MYLKSLELHGFKSFPDKTVLRFNPGTTVIVGPNGSGKSNITDAMRWVLGELSSKSLRGSKMEDVIFSGADGVRPMGFAEVSITFDNSGEEKTIQSDYDEITVTRRYYRAGDSAYFINRRPVRLRDICELFMNTGIGREGYSIVGQGRIAEIISKKSEERRSIFEEAAGITKYRYRKTESQKKLSETEANMLRVGDIAAELESRIVPLERDAAKARQYLELYDKKKRVDVSLWLYDMDRQRAALEKTESDTKMSAHELEMADDTMRQIEDQIERSYAASHTNRETSARLQDQINSARANRSKLENDARLIENNVQHAMRMLEDERKRSETANLTLESARAKLSELRESAAQIEGAIDGADTKCRELAKARDEAISERNLRDETVDLLFRDRQRLEGETNDLRVRLNVLRNSISDGAERKESIDSEIAGCRSELLSLDKAIADESSVIAGYECGITSEEERFRRAEGELATVSAEAEQLRSEISTVMAQIEAQSSRITAMERMLEHFEGYNNSVRFIMNESSAGRLTGIHGPLSHLIRVESKYAIALETSMGQALQNIVTSDEASAKAAIAALKRSGAGRATFYPITTVKAQARQHEMESAASCRGFIGFADELVTCDDIYRDIVRSVIGRICVFDNIDNASDMARARGWRVRAVTLDGQQINAGGSFTGGSARRDSGMLTRASQIDSMKSEKDACERKAEKLGTQLRQTDSRISSLTSERADADEKRRLMESLLSVEKTTVGELEAKRRVTAELIAKLESDIERFDEDHDRFAEDIKKLEKQISEADTRIASLINEREAVATERGAFDEHVDELRGALGDAQVELAGLIKDLESAQEAINDSKVRIADAEAEIVRSSDEIRRLGEEVNSSSERSGVLAREGEEQEAEIALLEEQRAALDKEGDRIEAQLTGLRRREKEQSAKKEVLFIAHTKNQNKLDGIRTDIDKMTSRLWDEYELTYNSASEMCETEDYSRITDENRAAAARDLSELKSGIKALGHVNIAAIDEYSETKERYDYIKRQMDDLESSKKELTDVIQGIEEDMRRMFTEAFEKINRNFGEVFRDLFGGGSAELSLTDPEDVLTSGIEISAAPPGKTIKSLSLLSGGEQAFIAIALMFALIKYSPSPFCIFDEIEAALDEVNVTRVANYVRRYSSEMQIIMITHRRGTMDIADTLYGVTMPHRGVSKVFTLDVSAADENDRFLSERAARA